MRRLRKRRLDLEKKWLWFVLGDALFVLIIGVWLQSASTCCRSVAQPAVGSPFQSPLTPVGPGLSEHRGTIPPVDWSAEPLYLPFVVSNERLYLPLLYGNASNIPVPLAPAPASIGQSVNTYFEWFVDNPNDRLRSYELYLEANVDVPRTLFAQSAAQRPYFAGWTLEPETQYAWRVVAVEVDNRRVAGPIVLFRTEGVAETPDVEQMVVIPAGEFLMGCDPARNPVGGCVLRKDTPLHPVYLDAYAIDKYEVTNRQYRACVAAGLCSRPLRDSSRTRPSYFTNPQYDYFPVLYVSWNDAQTYCAWQGKRLPTEAEWEKAARGPFDTRTWPWGEEYPNCSRANFTDDSAGPTGAWVSCVEDTTRVGSYPSGASPYGVMDLAGNVFEWVADRLDQIYRIHYYAISPYANPPGPAPNFEVREGPFYVIRGGSYRPRWTYTRTFHRHHGHRGGSSQLGVDIPYYRNDQVGFRCVRPLNDQ